MIMHIPKAASQQMVTNRRMKSIITRVLKIVLQLVHNNHNIMAMIIVERTLCPHLLQVHTIV